MTTCWRRFAEGAHAGVCERLQELLLDELGQAGALDWPRVSMDCFSIARCPLVPTLRTQEVPRALPLVLRFDRAVASGFRTVSQLGIGYRYSPAVEEGGPALRRGARADDLASADDRRVGDGGATAAAAEAYAATAGGNTHGLTCQP